MGIKRGSWEPEKLNKLATIRPPSKNGKYGARSEVVPGNGLSNSEKGLQSKGVALNSSINKNVIIKRGSFGFLF